MPLIDKIESKELNNHAFFGGVRCWFAGTVTRTQVLNFYQLEASDEAQLDEMKAKYDSYATLPEQLEYSGCVEGIGVNLEVGIITKQQAKTLFGMT